VLGYHHQRLQVLLLKQVLPVLGLPMVRLQFQYLLLEQVLV
jgi:hypothetical protein